MRLRRVLVILVAGVALLAGLAAAGRWALDRTGRTPGELVEYLERRLQGHGRLESVAVPVLRRWAVWLGEPDPADRDIPFVIPPWPPASAPASSAVLPRESGDPMRILVGPRRAVTSLAAAAQTAPDGAVIEVDPGDYVGDVAVWLQRALTIRGTGPGVRLIAAGRAAEDKAIWVIRRGRFVVENIEFIGARVADLNGAGIRFEGGDLVVRHCRFYANENGILAGGGAESSLAVEFSEFAYNGAGDGQSHGIYVGPGTFRLTGSYFHHANVGHLVKSRAHRNRIEYNRLSDESGGRASYELEFPDGGEAEVVGNLVEQGSGTRNSVIVSFGTERYRWPVNRLAMAHNTVVNDKPTGGTFVRVAPGAQAVSLRNNLWVGPGRLMLPADADVAGNAFVDWDSFVQPAREDFRLTAAARQRLGGAPLPPVAAALRPAYEYRHPQAVAPLAAAAALPGALQSGPP